MELTHNNYLRGYGNGNTWRVEIDPPRNNPLSYYEEACKAAEIIWSQKQGELHVLYSGGMDSEYVISVFKSLGMRVTPVIMKLKSKTGYYNQHDLDYAFRFCANNNLSYQLYELDFDKFIDSGEALSIVNSCRCARYEMAAAMWLASQVNGTVITGNDPPTILGMPFGYCLEEIEVSHSQLTYWKNNNINGTPFFLEYTSGMLLSFLKDTSIQDFVKRPIEYAYKDKSFNAISTDIVKVNVYNNQNKFVIEPRTKYTGYETIQNSIVASHQNVALANKNKTVWDGKCYYDYATLMNKLTVDKCIVL